MSFSEKLEDAVWGLGLAAVSGVAAGIAWVIRRTVTNQAQIELLKAEIAHRDQLREGDRAIFKEMQDAIKTMQADIKTLIGGHP
jgi:uncharacterized protein (DUF885 family)